MKFIHQSVVRGSISLLRCYWVAVADLQQVIYEREASCEVAKPNGNTMAVVSSLGHDPPHWE